MTTSPTSQNNDDAKVRQALVRSLTNQMNQSERHHRHYMVGQEEIADSARKNAERSDQGHHSILSMLDEVSDQIAEGHGAMATKADIAELQQATKGDISVLQQKMDRVLEHLRVNDHVAIPREQSTTFDPEGESFQ